MQGMCRETIRAGHATERAAFERAALLIFASQWAANSAIADYNIEPSKIAVVPFGANFIEPPPSELVRHHIEARSADRCELISIGVDWVRKGMPRAIELAEALNNCGLATRLTIIGCKPPSGVRVPPFSLTSKGLLIREQWMAKSGLEHCFQNPIFTCSSLPLRRLASCLQKRMRMACRILRQMWVASSWPW